MTENNSRIQRFRLLERIEHFVLILSFTTLGLTGIPQKYALSPISQAVIQFLGGIETIRIIHHTAAAIFLVEAIYHVIIVGYKLFVERKEATMLPGIKDGQDALNWFTFNLGIGKKYPKMPRFNFMEKAEYWAMLWGLIVMALTGLMLWNPIATTNYLPGEFIPAAKAAHGGEAVLAVLAIILWHFYNVHIKHWNWSMFKGTISHHEMVEEHGQELEKIETGKGYQPPAPEVMRQRLTLFAPVAAVVTIALAGLVYYFLTFESTAITTVPPAQAGPVYVRATATPQPPTATPAPATPTSEVTETPASGGSTTTASVDWNGTIGPMLKEKCTACHGSAGGFNAETYDEVLKVVTAGSPDTSKIVEVQKKGGHPGQLDDAQLAQLIDWIKAGAPQAAGGASSEGASGGTTASSETWASGIGQLFKDKCGTCHGQSGGFTATSYEDAVKMMTPGNPDTSKIVEVQKSGSHPGLFSADELTRVIDWIKAGAPQQ